MDCHGTDASIYACIWTPRINGGDKCWSRTLEYWGGICEYAFALWASGTNSLVPRFLRPSRSLRQNYHNDEDII